MIYRNERKMNGDFSDDIADIVADAWDDEDCHYYIVCHDNNGNHSISDGYFDNMYEMDAYIEEIVYSHFNEPESVSIEVGYTYQWVSSFID